jgi:anti-sigma factor RsiW
VMAEAHPGEIELLEYVEGDLEAQAAASVRSHLETCGSCAATVAELEQARTVLRASPVLELPAERSRAILAGLPRRERGRPAILELLSSRKRLAAVLVPVAAAAVAVAVVTTTGGSGREAERSADKALAATAQAAQTAAGAGGAEAAPPSTSPTLEATAAPVRSVAGTPAGVRKLLEEHGIAATVANGTVEVTGASEEAVKKALESLADGPVPVVIRP